MEGNFSLTAGVGVEIRWLRVVDFDGSAAGVVDFDGSAAGFKGEGEGGGDGGNFSLAACIGVEI